VFGPLDAAYLLHLTGKLIGMQYFDEIAPSLDARRGGAKDFADFLRALFLAQDDTVELASSGDRYELHQRSWKLMADLPDYHPACLRLLEGLVEGLAAGCGRFIPVRLTAPADGRPPFVWTIG